VTSPQPPIAPRRPVERTHHGDTVVDEYEWLRDKDDPQTLAYLSAENDWTERQTEHLKGLREAIFGEIRARTRETDLSVPVRHGRWWYYARTQEGSQYSIQCRRPVLDPADWNPPASGGDDEQVLLDLNAEAAGHEFFSLGAFALSDDDRLLAWSVDTTGDERYTIRIQDLDSGQIFADEIVGVGAGATWAADGRHLFYVQVDSAWRPHQVWRHELGVDDDVMVFEENDERYFVGVGRSQSEKYLVIGASSKVTSEARILEANDPVGDFRIVVPRRDGIEYSVEHAVIGGEDRLLLLHNADAPDFQLNAIDVDEAGVHDTPGAGQVLVGHRSGVRLEDIDLFARFAVLSYRREALPRIAIVDLSGGLTAFESAAEVDFGEELSSCGVGANSEWDPPLLRVGYGSFVTPVCVIDIDPFTGERLLRKQAPVEGGYDPLDYEQHRVWATAEDGVQIPVSVVCRKDTPRDGTAPGLLYGYGSYETSLDPGMSIPRLSLLDRGFVFAIAHVRGGGELGRAWYENGRLMHKRNSFSDFVAAAHCLVDEGWCRPPIAEGGSAGGLLMGAVANLAPDAFSAIVADVPFVDPLTSILDPALPLTVIEWDEWGNPLDDPEAYAYIKSYAPYDNVRNAAYPPILAVTSLHDTRVLYVEPAKWVARLRERSPRTEVLLKTELNAGHGGVSGRYDAWRERAFELAWIIDKADIRTT
jgi:oligopeptidase B